MITLYESITNTDAIEHVSVKEFFNRLNRHDKFSPLIREIAIKNLAEYQERKKKLPCFSLGKFANRKKDGLLEYSSILAFDLDKLSNQELYESVFNKLKKLDYVYAAFPSVSKRGLRVFIKTNSVHKYHKENYKTVCDKLELDLTSVLKDPAHLDKSTKDVSRGWFFEPLKDGELFVNPVAKIFEVPNSKIEFRIKEDPILDHKVILNMCRVIVESRVSQGRNSKVMQITRLASEYGIDQNSIFTFCLLYKEDSIENPFSIEEIEKTVRKNIMGAKKPIKWLERDFVKKFGAKAFNNIKKQKETLSSHEVESLVSEASSPSNKFEEIKDFIQSNYNLRFNVISKELDVSEKFQSEKEEVNLHDIECNLFANGFNGFQQKLNAIVGSNDYVIKYNPLVEYLDALPQWSPEEHKDYISDLASYVTTDDDDFFKLQFKKMLVRNLACSLGRLDFNKQVFTLVGAQQNLGKTTFIRFLIPDKLSMYYKEELNLGDKDSLKSLATDLFIILDEVHKFSSKELNKIKSWISKKMVKLRLPYRKADMTADRIANFFATSNDENFLTDNQNVRWLVFKVKNINHDFGGEEGYEQNVNIDNVYAQALYLLNKSDFNYKLTKEELKHMEDRNSTLFSHQTLEEDLILKYFEYVDIHNIGAIPKKEYFRKASDVLSFLNARELYLKTNNQKVGAALTKLGFEKGSERIDGADPRNGYYMKERKEPTTNYN